MRKYIVLIFLMLAMMPLQLSAQLTKRQTDIVKIAAMTASGNLDSLYVSLDGAIDSVLTVNEAKEVLVHTYAYCGFPRALQGLRTLVKVLDARKAEGLPVNMGREATPLDPSRDRYQRGREILAEISGVPADAPKADYAVLSPEIEAFLKEHLFSDLFERDVLSYVDRELATVSVIAALGRGVGPMLQSHSRLAMNLGLTREQLDEALKIVDNLTIQ